jgi:hypothetical protein
MLFLLESLSLRISNRVILETAISWQDWQH